MTENTDLQNKREKKNSKTDIVSEHNIHIYIIMT